MGNELQPVEKKETGNEGIERLIAATAHDMEKVNELILERASSHVEVVPQIAMHLIEAGGKRLRPMLTLASASLFGQGKGNEIKYAAAVEFMHNATLLHDDVVDESDMRRGKPAARKIWGNQASVLVGDFLLGQAFMMLVETQSMKALDTLSKAAATIAEGEVLQLSKTKNLATRDRDYMQIINAKTATLFEAATRVGAMAGQASQKQQDAMAIYGRELGLAFQLVDDVLDYGGINRGAKDSPGLGKNTGDDLREGKMTLPIILALEKASESERGIISDALGRENADAGQFAKVLDIINRYHGLETAIDRALGHAENARNAILELPDSELREILRELTHYTVCRVR